jgi:transcriptional regulator with XRE-family HTH domain
MARRKTQLPEVRREHESALGDLRVAAGLTIGELARQVGVSGALITNLQCGYASPTFLRGPRAGTWKPKTLAICAVLGAEPEDVFPGYACRLQYRGELTPAQVHAITHVSEPSDPEARVEGRSELIGILCGMKPKLREVLVLRCLGFTLEEVGEVLGVSRQRACQLAANAERVARDKTIKLAMAEDKPKYRMAG